jgi:thiol-disulfide isomerase/thioredoxin
MRRAALVLLLLLSCKSSDVPRKLKLIPAGSGNEKVEALVVRQLGVSQAEKRTLLVYVGAGWCEPCRYFHHAAEAGQLDAEFGDLDLLVFDLDVDGQRLANGRYDTHMIPLLAVPNADGTSSTRFMSGSIKGDGAVAQMTPRLKALLGR